MSARDKRPSKQLKKYPERQSLNFGNQATNSFELTAAQCLGQLYADGDYAAPDFNPSDQYLRDLNFLQQGDVIDGTDGVSQPYGPQGTKRGRSAETHRSNSDSELQTWLNEDLPFENEQWYSFFDSNSHPRAPERQFDVDLPNPFAVNAVRRYPGLKTCAMNLASKSGEVNGYLKFRFNLPEPEKQEFVLPPDIAINFGQDQFGVHHKALPPPAKRNIPSLPPAFGRCNLDGLDSHFLRFYLVAFCKGRTLLEKTNLWFKDVAPMASRDACVKHAVLALAAGYWLHFSPNEEVLTRANNHYRRATELLTDGLRDVERRKPGREDGLVSALLLLFIDDAVNFELRKGKGQESCWRQGARTARWILSDSDPGQRYYRSCNVQWSNSRLSNANFAAFVDILALPVTPLKVEETDRMHLWLLQGRKEESRKIHGGTGLCPKLLHMFAQITHLCARMNEEPDSEVLPIGAEALLKELTDFQQWSEISTAYPSTEALLESCVLDRHGKVKTRVEVTQLTAESWVATAKIYFLCRFFRLPRSHPDVKTHLDALLRCIERMPMTGQLFTSQSPFFCIFLMCLVSCTVEERRVGRDWYEIVIGDGTNRSSVPPVWEAVQRLWTWLDSTHPDAVFDESKPIGERNNWWEALVKRITETEGEIPLY